MKLGAGEVAVPTLIHTFYLIYSQITHHAFTKATVRSTYDYGGRLQPGVGLTAAVRGIHQPSGGSSFSWENSFRSYLEKKICLLREKEGGGGGAGGAAVAGKVTVV